MSKSVTKTMEVPSGQVSSKSKSPLAQNRNKTSKQSDNYTNSAHLQVKTKKSSPKGSPKPSPKGSPRPIPKGSPLSVRESTRPTPISRQGSPGSSDSDIDHTDSKSARRRGSPKHVVSLNLNSRNNPLHPDKVMEGILPGGRPKILLDDHPSTSSQETKEEPKSSRDSTPDKETAPKLKSFYDDEEFRQKVKKMDYNTVFMLAQRSKGPQQYKYRKILQEMYDEQNK